jgi:hypothetical protein
MENGETKEKLVIKNVALSDKQKLAMQAYEYPFQLQIMTLISRYPFNAGKKWIEANEREALDWDFNEQKRTIFVDVGNTIKNAMY